MRTTFINAGWPLKAVLGEKEVGSFLRRSLRDFQPPINMWGGGVGKINCFQCPSHGWHQIHENSFHHRRQEQASLITLGKRWRCKSDQKELPPSGQSRGGQSWHSWKEITIGEIRCTPYHWANNQDKALPENTDPLLYIRYWLCKNSSETFDKISMSECWMAFESGGGWEGGGSLMKWIRRAFSQGVNNISLNIFSGVNNIPLNIFSGVNISLTDRSHPTHPDFALCKAHCCQLEWNLVREPQLGWFLKYGKTLPRRCFYVIAEKLWH